MDFSLEYARLDALEEAEYLLRQAAESLCDAGLREEADGLLPLREALKRRIDAGHVRIRREIALYGKSMVYFN